MLSVYDLPVALAIPDTRFNARGLLHPFIDYDAPKAYQNRIRDEMGAAATRPAAGLA